MAFDDGLINAAIHCRVLKTCLVGFIERRPKRRRALVDDYSRYYVSAFFCVEGRWGEGQGRHAAGGKNVLGRWFLFSPTGSCVMKQVVCVGSRGRPIISLRGQTEGGRDLVLVVHSS